MHSHYFSQTSLTNNEFLVENIDENGAADLIRVFLFNDKSTVPLITANLNMPLSEVDLE